MQRFGRISTLAFIFCAVASSTPVDAWAASQDNNVEWDGVLSDTTANFVSPMVFDPGDTLTLSIRVRADDLTGAACRVYFSGIDRTEIFAMSRTEDGVIFDRWSATFEVPQGTTALWYRFSLTDGSDTDWYDAGAADDPWSYRGMSEDGREFLDFQLIPGFATPAWSQEAIYYQIFPDRFYDGNPDNDRLYPDDCFWYLDYAPLCRDDSCPGYASQCASHGVEVPEDYEKNCAFHTDWSEPPNDGPCDFYGGDLEGIEAKLDYLEALNASAIYLNPIFRSQSNHKYDVQDYDTVDPRFGGWSAADALSSAVKARGLHLIADGVFNHEADLGLHYNGWGNFTYDPDNGQVDGYDFFPDTCGAYEEEFLNDHASNWTDCSSDYSDWFKIWIGDDIYDIDRDGDETEPAAHTCGWYGFEFMPEIDYKSPSNPDSGARTWLYGGSNAANPFVAAASLAGRWLADGQVLGRGFDGWRLDVPDNAGYFNNDSDGDCSRTTNDASIWRGFRKAVKAIDADKVVIGEIWTDATNTGEVNWLAGDTFDGVMNYHFFAMPMSCFIAGVGVHNEASECADYADLSLNSSTSVDSLDAWLATQRRLYPAPAYFSSQNLLSSHDTARFMSRVGGDSAKLREAMIFQMTLPGAPMIYYGDEVGLQGATNEQGRAPFPWDAVATEGSAEAEMLAFSQGVTCVRRAYGALSTGSMLTLWTNNAQRTYGYGRFDDEARIAVALNNDASTHTLNLEVYRLEILNGTTMVDVLTGAEYTVADGVVSLGVPAHAGAVLVPSDIADRGLGCLAGNAPPVADAGEDVSACVGEGVVLSAAGSSDPDGDELSFLWYDAAGNVVGNNVNLILNDLDVGDYVYTVDVSDGVYTDSDSVAVRIEECCSGCDCPSAAPFSRGAGFVLPVGWAILLLSARRRTFSKRADERAWRG